MKNTIKTDILVLIISLLVAAVGAFIMALLPDSVFNFTTAIISGVALGYASINIGYTIVDWITNNGR